MDRSWENCNGKGGLRVGVRLHTSFSRWGAAQLISTPLCYKNKGNEGTQRHWRLEWNLPGCMGRDSSPLVPVRPCGFCAHSPFPQLIGMIYFQGLLLEFNLLKLAGGLGRTDRDRLSLRVLRNRPQ